MGPGIDPLFGRFSESVFAASVLYSILSTWSLDLPPGLWIDRYLIRDINEFHDTVLCPPPEQCRDDGRVYLKGMDYIQWRIAWFNRILENHPDVWFADEVRFRLALDSYLMGEKARCRSLLETLSKDAQLYIAKKARALLDAILDRGLLEPSE